MQGPHHHHHRFHVFLGSTVFHILYSVHFRETGMPCSRVLLSSCRRMGPQSALLGKKRTR